jgi:hypothetical protein
MAGQRSFGREKITIWRSPDEESNKRQTWKVSFRDANDAPNHKRGSQADLTQISCPVLRPKGPVRALTATFLLASSARLISTRFASLEYPDAATVLYVYGAPCYLIAFGTDLTSNSFSL